ncbi:hypothetical protein [Spirosoma foliorum]|uniref:Uncharacterized protein n=1 Tax=Spirosoma foliorum TaxID=2710596 RepID=A0A7G5H6N3_9BACT|nr:hypothetical protein [Spirosoma foliorum]QMW06775.1 hypothetical protein H3H32_18715 [Spirosoma foliorum]
MNPHLFGQVGRKRLKRKRLATLAQLAGVGALNWQWLEVIDWHDSQPQRVEYATGTAVCGAARAVSFR